MPDLTIEQALADAPPGGVKVVARSPGFVEEWEPEFLRLCTAFGRPPAGAYLPTCVFARPLARGRVAVVQAAAEGSPPALRFHCLAVPDGVYTDVGATWAEDVCEEGSPRRDNVGAMGQPGLLRTVIDDRAAGSVHPHTGVP